MFNNFVWWKLGSGKKIKFWEDVWVGGGESMLGKYLRLYIILEKQHHEVHQMELATEGVWEWSFKWRRNLLESELEMASNFMQEIEVIQIQPQYSDKWVWMVDPSGEYTAKSAYGLLSQEGQVEDSNNKAVFVDLWKMKVPSKVQHFVWRLVRNNQEESKENECRFRG